MAPAMLRQKNLNFEACVDSLATRRCPAGSCRSWPVRFGRGKIVFNPPVMSGQQAAAFRACVRRHYTVENSSTRYLAAHDELIAFRRANERTGIANFNHLAWVEDHRTKRHDEKNLQE
jgi:hypothetical protein